MGEERLSLGVIVERRSELYTDCVSMASVLIVSLNWIVDIDH
jgi:hypothetical protein